MSFFPLVCTQLGCRQQVLVLMYLMLGCHVALESTSQPRPPRGLAKADANDPAWDALLPKCCHPLPLAQIKHIA